MDIVGIICEYNPFHNGHLHHLKMVKELYPNSLIILVMSSSFTQRGTPSIINKWDKTKIALSHEVDLVFELPYFFTVQSATYFAKAALEILNCVHANILVFGSEENNIENLLKKDESELLLANDILGRAYLQEIKNNNYKITPISIKRLNNYHSKTLNKDFPSATSIREAFKNNLDISNYLPINSSYLNANFLEDNYFLYLKYKIISEKESIKKYLDVDEGLEYRILKYIYDANNIHDLISLVKTKRYTYSKLSRMFNHILCGFTKDFRNKFEHITYIRLLGFNQSGKIYLNKIKKDLNIPLITNFSNSKDPILQYEAYITKIYALVLNSKEEKELIEAEYKNHPQMFS